MDANFLRWVGMHAIFSGKCSFLGGGVPLEVQIHAQLTLLQPHTEFHLCVGFLYME